MIIFLNSMKNKKLLFKSKYDTMVEKIYTLLTRANGGRTEGVFF